MFELKDKMDELAVVKVACIGKTFDYWKNNMPDEAQKFLLEGNPTDFATWNEVVDVAFVIADSREKNVINELKKTMEAIEGHVVSAWITILISDGEATIDEPFLNIDVGNFDGEHEVFDFIYKTVKSIYDLVGIPGFINLDLADVASIFRNSREFACVICEASGENAALVAGEEAVHKISSMWGDFKNVKSVLLNVTGAEENLSMFEINEDSKAIAHSLDGEVNIIWGASVDDSFGDKIGVCLWMAK